MLVRLNGQEQELRAGATVSNLLERWPDVRGVAVALDGEVVPRGQWALTPLREGARVEVVAAVQGG